jgi:hypothetical protein
MPPISTGQSGQLGRFLAGIGGQIGLEELWVAILLHPSSSLARVRFTIVTIQSAQPLEMDVLRCSARVAEGVFENGPARKVHIGKPACERSMKQTLNRREMLRQMAGALTSFFCVGRLQFDAAKACEQEDLHLAAATSFEFMIQKIFIPYGAVDGTFEISPEVRAKAFEVSKWLNPSNAPQIFREAELLSRQGEVVVRFSDTVSISLSTRSIDQLRRCLTKHPGAYFFVPGMNDHDVVRYVVGSFSFGENWKYD